MKKVNETGNGKIATQTQELKEFRRKAGRYDEVEPQLQMLASKSERYDQLLSELPALRDKAARNDELSQNSRPCATLPGDMRN